jgi:ribonuclease I
VLQPNQQDSYVLAITWQPASATKYNGKSRNATP